MKIKHFKTKGKLLATLVYDTYSSNTTVRGIVLYRFGLSFVSKKDNGNKQIGIDKATTRMGIPSYRHRFSDAIKGHSPLFQYINKYGSSGIVKYDIADYKYGFATENMIKDLIFAFERAEELEISQDVENFLNPIFEMPFYSRVKYLKAMKNYLGTH